MKQLKTRIFLDGGDADETRQADALLKSGGLSGIKGQTTNPSLIMKNLAAHLGGRTITVEEALGEYRRIVTAMAAVTEGPISIQVTGGPDLTAEEMLTQARERIGWIPNGVIKFPCTHAGLTAAHEFCREGPVNMTLVFSQEQAAAVYAATAGAPHEVFVSPFVGRLDDRGENGMEVVANILGMYRTLDGGHVQVLTASVRTLEHLMYALFLESDVVTLPYTVLTEWADGGFALPDDTYKYPATGLKPLPYHTLTLDKSWDAYDISHPLTDAGVEKFWADWQAVTGM